MKKLSLSQWTSIAEIFGMLAVVISLIFVGIEIKQNTNQMEATGLSTGLNSMRSVSELTSTRQKTEFILRGMEDFDSLTPIERAMFESEMMAVIMDFEITRNLYDIGFLGETEYRGFEEVVSAVLRSPGVEEYYEYAKEFVPPRLNDLFVQMNKEYEGERTFLDYLRFGTSDTPPTNLQQTTGEDAPLTGNSNRQ